ncbi:MFS transporter [Orbaceae bacterium ESL0727]|nr:MFS transporter [Orbaceae bacterium ESL0727]
MSGIISASWAVIVPYAKVNTGVSDATLGFLLLCLGFGAMAAMPLTGSLTSKLGCQKVIAAAAIMIIVIIPFLAIITDPLLLAITLFIFGMGSGIMDCAMNVQAILVEKSAPKPLMSGFHGMYSVGGIVGAGTMTCLLIIGCHVIVSTLIMSALILAFLFISYKKLLPYANPAEGPTFAFPKGVVIIFGLICFIFFMAEGTVLDWSAVYLVDNRGIAATEGGLGFAAFSIAMTLGRLSGDAIVARFGSFGVVLIGTLFATVGFITVINSMTLPFILSGYVLIGIGCSNIVPIMFSQIGKQKSMSQITAVPAVTTMGYIGILAGPAIISGIAHYSSIVYGFVLVTVLIVIAAMLAFSIRTILQRTN